MTPQLVRSAVRQLQSPHPHLTQLRNTGGSDTVSITIEVNDVAPSSLSYSPNSHTNERNGDDFSNANGQWWNRNILVCIPISLLVYLLIHQRRSNFRNSKCSRVFNNLHNHASNTGGSDTATLTFVVNDVTPSSLNYNPNSFTLTKGTAMTSVTPTVSGGTVTSWSSSPSLPAGLSLDSSTGAISGTPSAVVSSTTYNHRK